MNRTQLLQALPKFSQGAELGVCDGDLSQTILEQVIPYRLYLVDAWRYLDLGYNDKLMVNDKRQEDRYRRVVRRFFNSQQVRIIRSLTDAVGEIFDRESLDWVYVDADHSYQGCLRDLTVCDPVVKPTGYILGHDYDNKLPGVIQAVSEFVAKRGYFLTYVTTEPQCPSYIISKNLASHEWMLSRIQQLEKLYD